MSKKYTKNGFLFLILCFSSFSWGQNLLHYWNFNNNGSVAAITTPTQTIGGASIVANISGISAINFTGGTGQNFSVLNLNAQNSDPSGTHLRFDDPIGSALVFSLPTTGYENAIVKFATRRSGSGAGTQVWSYSTDGTNFTFFSNVLPNNGDPALATLDFSSLPATDNNPNFKLKVEFQLAPGGNVGNNRFDNFTVQGTSFVGGADTTAPTVAFLPLNGATNVNAAVNVTIAFNEAVRLFDNSAITNANIDAVVELRLNNASGALVPFDATFASNTITINPTSNLANNQLYYVALLSNSIEDTSDNAITTTQSASFTTSNPSTSSIDLSTYVRVARYNLPEPLTTTAPTNNLLCQEASAVAYNWDTDTLFITADGSTSVTQVSKTGVLINTMTMALGSSPQGTDFYDTEGLTYIGNGQFVMSEERDRQLVKFTYAAGTTLTRANTQTVKIGTFVPNTGTEGLCYDPLTGGFICLKEIDPIGIFQTNVDFAAGTATNGSATTVNSINLFDPALLGFTDVADVFVLANIPSQSTSPNLLVLSQENAQVVNIDRNGNIASTLTIVADPGDTLSVSAQQHEGITMDNNGIIYIVNENGGGDINHPQLWVYAPSNGINLAPTAIALTNTVPTIIENSITTPAVRVADIVVTDDGLGTNTFSLSGADANDFQITASSLFIKPGTVLDFETKSTYNVTVNVNDATVGATPDASVNFVLTVTDLVNETPQLPTITVSEVAPWSSGNSPVGADWFEVTNNGATALNITGWKVDDNSNSFAAAIALTGITSIAPGESVIFLESSTGNPAATVIASFKSTWFGANPPASLQVGTYQGSGIGLSTGGDAVNIYDASGNLQANVVFGASPTTLFKTFNNAVGLANTTISLLSEIGVNDAFAAVNDPLEIGSPGSVGRLFISEVAPWSSGNSPVGADWFEVTNTKAVAVDITGWKVDDNSQSPLAAVALNGITSINPGESVIFIETNNLATATTTFLNNWFGTNPTSGLRIGNYSGSGIGLGTGGDQVNLYNTTSTTPQTSVLFGSSPAAAPYTTFDNAIGRNSLVTPITQFSAVGTNGAFIAANSPTEIGSPGTIVTAPCPTITVTAQPASSIACSGGTTTVTVTATGGTTPYTGTGTFTVGAGAYSYTVTDAKGCTATVNGTVISIPDTTSPSIYFQPSALLPGVTGPSTTQSPYLLSQSTGGKFTSILSVNDVVGSYRMVGIPDGLGAFDNNNGTFTLLMNHEIGNTQGIVRAHGSAGAFVSKWIINKSNLAVLSGSDLIQSVYTWNTTSNSFVQGTTQFNRFCSADLASTSAFYNQATGLGTQERIFVTGEESGTEGRAFGHIVTGTSAGVSYELPYLGKFSWENAVASPSSGVKTVVAGTDDSTVNGQVYFYIGTKTNTGTDIDKAGLNNGKLFGVKVTGLVDELSASIPAPNTAFTLADLGFVQNSTGVTLNTNSVTAGVTNFLRPEDGAFDPSNPNDFYFVTTNAFSLPSRLWRLRFNDIANPETGGTITAVLDGTEGQRMLDNMTIDKFGHILLQEDPGGQAHSAKVWQYTIATDVLTLVGKHDPARFGDLVGPVTTPATSPFNNDEESSGIIDVSDILGPGMFLLDVQAHYTTGLTNLTEVVQGGQLLAFFNPASMSASPITAAPAAITACSGTGIDLGTPATADNCSVASVTNNAPSTFPVGTTNVTWTVTDASGNTATATQTVTVSNLVASSNAGTITCPGGTTTVSVIATGGTAPYTGTGTFTVGAGGYSYTVTDATGCTATTTGTVISIPDTTSPSIYFQPSALLPGVTGPSTTQSPYLLSQSTGGKFTSILSVNDVVGSYRMVGIPDGLGAFDNNNGTFTLLMNHEIGNTQGIVRAHGSAGAFVSKWIINKSNLAVLSGSDLIQSVYTWNTTSNSFVQGTTQFNRFCSADLASTSAFYNQATGLGTQERIFVTGEESGTEGRAFGHIVTGTSAGVSYELPYLGKFSWENAVASPSSGVKTVVAGTDDSTVNGQVYFYIGTKTNTGTDIDKAGLNNGKLFGVKVTGLVDELSASIPAPNTAFTLADLGFVQNSTGVTLNTNSVTAGVTNFLRPEDGAFDPSNPNDFYFVTTNAFSLPSRLWRLRFNDIANPETGGTITAVLDGTEGQRMLDNMTIDKFGHILLQEDPGGQAHSAKVWQYTIATDVLTLVGKHDPARFGDLVGPVTTPATSPFNNDEESSGIIDVSDILGPGMFLLDVQAHYTTGLTNLTEVVQGGQLLAFFNPASMSASPITAAPAAITACSGTGIDLGTPATADNCSVASVTNNAPSTFPVGTTNVTWTVTDASGNTATATQTVTVNNLVASATAGTIACNGGTTTVTVTATGGTEPYIGTGTFTVSAGAYSYTVTDATGCTSTVTGTITQPAQLTTTTTITSSTAYTWSVSGLTYNASGVYTFNTVAANGCTVINTLNLTITVNSFNLGTSCGGTVSSLAVTVVATPVSGATTYTFRITNLSTSASFIVTRPVNNFALSNYPGITLGTSYQVEVSVNGGANYGTPCIVNTPSPTSTIGAQCGTTVASMTTFVYATYYASVNGYRFRITNNTTNAVQVYDALSGQNRFSFSQLPAAFVSFGTTYYVEVALRNTDGTYLPYSAGCNITTPAFPTSEVILSQCDMTATSNTQNIAAVVVSGATGYRFELTNLGLSYSFSIDRTVNTFNLNMFPGLLSGTTYTVRVAVRIGGVWGPLTGKPCNITTPGIAVGGTKEVAVNNKFAAIAYPNPFAENFMFDVTTSAQSDIQIRVYDMLGKQVENRNVATSDINNVQIGDAYPSGVYNVVVSQGENTKTLRVIKR